MSEGGSILIEYALGLLPAAELDAMDRELARSPQLRAELTAVRETLMLVPRGLPPRQPRSSARGALLGALDSGARFRPFADDLTRHFDLPRARVLELFQRIDDDGAFEAGPLPGIAVMHFAGGPRAIAPDTGFVRLAAGLEFPYHRHHGHEINYVLSGALRDGDGCIYVPGEAIVKTPGSSHAFSVPPDQPTLIAVVQAGFDILEDPGG